MARKNDPEVKDASLGGKLQQDAISEDEADELRERGQGFEREPSSRGARKLAEQADEPGAAARQPGRMLAGSGENLGGHGLQVREAAERGGEPGGEAARAGPASAGRTHLDAGDEVERLAQGESPSEDVRSYRTWPEDEEAKVIAQSAQHGDHSADYRDLNAREGHANPYPARTGDESVTEQYRATNKGASEGIKTQQEEDFGERGLHTAGGPFDTANEPSIFDPDEDE